MKTLYFTKKGVHTFKEPLKGSVILKSLFLTVKGEPLDIFHLNEKLVYLDEIWKNANQTPHKVLIPRGEYMIAELTQKIVTKIRGVSIYRNLKDNTRIQPRVPEKTEITLYKNMISLLGLNPNLEGEWIKPGIYIGRSLFKRPDYIILKCKDIICQESVVNANTQYRILILRPYADTIKYTIDNNYPIAEFNNTSQLEFQLTDLDGKPLNTNQFFVELILK